MTSEDCWKIDNIVIEHENEILDKIVKGELKPGRWDDDFYYDYIKPVFRNFEIRTESKKFLQDLEDLIGWDYIIIYPSKKFTFWRIDGSGGFLKIDHPESLIPGREEFSVEDLGIKKKEVLFSEMPMEKILILARKYGYIEDKKNFD